LVNHVSNQDVTRGALEATVVATVTLMDSNNNNDKQEVSKMQSLQLLQMGPKSLSCACVTTTRY
jgi:hypothetical protein